MPEQVSEEDINRTFSILREFREGKQLLLPNGQRIGMGIDLSIGFIYDYGNGREGIGGMATLDLKELNKVLTKHNIGFAI